MRKLLSIASIVLILVSCEPGKEKTKEYHFPQVGWTIHVPVDFTVMDSAQVETMKQKGADAVEKTYDTPVDFSDTKTLISFKKDKMNVFTATVMVYDAKIDGDWDEANKSLKQIMFETFTSQTPGVKIDTSSNVDLINGMDFQVFKAKMTYPNKMVLNTILYSKLYKGYDFGITLAYTDDKVGERFRKILASSTFVK